MKFDRGTLRQIGLASTALSAILYVASPAFADGNNFLSPVTNLFGGNNNNKVDDDPADIDYRPRPTLVVPPTNDLPAPHAATTRSADWPKSPDSIAARRARADSRRPAPSADSMLDGVPPSPPPAETAVGPNGQKCSMQFGVPVCMSGDLANAGGVFNWFGGNNNNGGGLMLGGSGDNGDVHLSANPGRKYLSDPPVSYLAPAPITEEQQEEANKAVAKSEEKPMWCVVPGMVGCTPDKGQIVHVPGSETAAAAPAGGGATTASPAAPAQPAAPAAPKTCMFGGFSGCSN